MLVVEDGSLLVVKARPQPVLVVSADGSPLALLRAAYHLGNRHVPLEVRAGHLQLEPDHVLAEMLRRMGLRVDEMEAPFEPEAGAYDASSMGQGLDHGRAHDHSGAPAGDHDHDHGHNHDHDASCGHGSDHGHPHR